MNISELNMFDRIFFEADLPTEDLPEEIKDQDISELEFQTSDLGRNMETWSVSTAGELFQHEVEQELIKDDSSEEGFVVKEKHNGIKKVEKTTSVNFYRVFETEDKDYWVSYDALFHKGKLVLVDLNEMHEVDKEQRTQAKEQAEKFMKEFKEKAEHKGYKLMAPVKFILGVFLVTLHWTGRNLSNLHSKL